MKLCAIVPTPEVKPVPGMLAYCAPVEQAFPKLRSYGYEGIEFITTDPAQYDWAGLEALLAQNGLTACAVNTGRVCGELGLTLSDPDADIRERAVRRTLEIVDFAAHFQIPINVGILRGQYRDGIPREQTWDWAVRALRRIGGYAWARGVGVAIETVCFLQSNFLNTLAEARRMIDEVASPAVGVMCDVFQMHIEEHSICDALVRHQEMNLHVHLCDSNRRYPGTAGINFPAVINALRRAGYRGACAVEAMPWPDQDEAARRSAEYLLTLMRA